MTVSLWKWKEFHLQVIQVKGNGCPKEKKKKKAVVVGVEEQGTM